MKKLLLLLAFAGLYLFPAYGQVGPISITSSQCAAIAVGNNYSTVGIQVTGTWTGTLQAEVSIAGQSPADTQVTPSTSSTPTSTITANGLYTASVAGTSTFLLCGDTVASGTAVVYLNISSAAVKLNGGGGNGGSLVSSIAALNTAQTAPTGTVRTQCPSAINPFAWINAADSSWYQQLGIDTTTTSIFSPNGVLTHCRLEYFNDTGTTPQFGANQDDLIYVWHQLNTGDAANTPGYGMYIRGQTSTSATGNLGRIGGLYVEGFVQGNPSQLVTSLDTGAFGVRGNVTDNRTGNGCTTVGTCAPLVGVTGVAFDNQNGQGSIARYGLYGQATVSPNNGSAGGATVAGVVGQLVAGGATGSTNNFGTTYWAQAPTGVLSAYNFLTLFYADDVSNLAGSPPSDTYNYYDAGGDIFISGQSGATSILWTPQINATGGPLVMNGSPSILGGIATSQYSAPGSTGLNAVNIGTTGATSYSYVVVARDSAGGTVASSTLTTATGNATLNSSNFNEIRIGGVRYQNGAVAFFDIYRTASGGTPSTTGKIGICSPTIGAKSNLTTTIACSFDDKGLAGDSTSVPSGNSTGGVQAYKFSTLTNCSSSASPAVCGASSGGSVVVAAAATSVVVDTTAVTANSQIFAQYDSSLGTKLGVTCNVTVALPAITARTAGTSFTLTIPVAPTTNPACYSYSIVN